MIAMMDNAVRGGRGVARSVSGGEASEVLICGIQGMQKGITPLGVHARPHSTTKWGRNTFTTLPNLMRSNMETDLANLADRGQIQG